MKRIPRNSSWPQRTLLAGGLAVILAGLLFLALDPGRELGAQNKQWTAADHEKTNFPLLGMHRTVPCADCHLDGVLAGTPTSCEACHWDRRQDDRYRTLLGMHCGDCHTPFGWKKLKANSWDHGRQAGYPLSGVHKTMDCDNCHPDVQFDRQAVLDCYACHRGQYQQAANHVAGNYSTDCRQCHFSQTTWNGALTTHTKFPLLGRHMAAACLDCHKNEVYAGTPQACVSCHLADYDKTQNPNHRLAGYSTDCVSCHGSSAQNWTSAAVNHDRYWPLLGAHKTLLCDQCHAAGYNLPRDCYGCHKNDYDATTQPNHKLAGYATTCQNCHFSSHTSWNQAVFTHKFPITSGDHAGLACTECHLSGNYLVFSCIDCHAHVKSEMDDQHDDVGGYAYNSQACYACHPGGRAVGASGIRRRR